MPDVDIPAKTTGSQLSAAEFETLVAAVEESLSETMLATSVGDGKLALSQSGAITGLTITPATPATVGEIITGTDTGAKVFSAKNLGDVGAWGAAGFSSGTLTVDFSSTLKRHITLSAAVTTFSLTLDERHTGILEVNTGGTSYPVTFPVGWKIPSSVQDTSRVWTPGINKTHYVSFVKRGSTVSVLFSDGLVVAA